MVYITAYGRCIHFDTQFMMGSNIINYRIRPCTLSLVGSGWFRNKSGQTFKMEIMKSLLRNDTITNLSFTTRRSNRCLCLNQLYGSLAQSQDEPRAESYIRSPQVLQFIDIVSYFQTSRACGF